MWLGEHTREWRRANAVVSTTMSEHQRHTEFLRQCIVYDESARCQELDEGINRLQRDLRCVWRAVWLMFGLTSLMVAGLGYGVILADNLPYNIPQFMVNLICGLGLGSLICLLAFVGLGMLYRMKLDHRREECRQLITKLLESRLGKPITTSLRDDRVGKEYDSAVPVANEGSGSPDFP